MHTHTYIHYKRSIPCGRRRRFHYSSFEFAIVAHTYISISTFTTKNSDTDLHTYIRTNIHTVITHFHKYFGPIVRVQALNISKSPIIARLQLLEPKNARRTRGIYHSSCFIHTDTHTYVNTLILYYAGFYSNYILLTQTYILHTYIQLLEKYYSNR